MSGAPAVEEPPVHRPNPLATLSMVLGILTLSGQVFGICTTMCTPLFLGLPTILTLFMAWYGLRQARQTGVGLEASIIGLITGGVNLALNLIWVLLTALAGLLWVLVVLLQP